MPQTAPWNLKQLKLTLSLNGTTVPITAVSCQFELNGLPQATVSVPLGRDMRSLLPAPIPTQFSGSLVLPASVTASVVYAAGSDQAKAFGLPASGPFTLFSGYLAGVGYTRSNSSSSLQLYLRHWLSDLDYSSIYSRYSQPTNPADFSIAAILPSSTGGSSPIYAQTYDYGRNISAPNIQGDIWAKALQPYLVALSAVDGLEIVEQAVSPSPATNTVAAAALKKMTSYPSLAMSAAAAVDSVAGLMEVQLQNLLRTNAALASHTFWDVIAGSLCPEYGFTVVPRVSDALVVPFIPTLQTPYITVSADEYVMASIEGNIPRPLKAVGLIAGLQFGAGSDARPDQAQTVGGWYSNPTMQKGMILISRGPRWSEQLVGLTAAQRNAAAGQGGQPVATSSAPGAAGTANSAFAAGVTAAANATSNVLDAMAQARYAHELDRNKQGFVAGPLRMDIAPGSIVEVQPDGLQWLNANQLTSFYGAVARVTIELDAEAMSGGTSLHITHCRTSSENQDPGRTVTSHPLFAKVYSGAGMLANPTPAGSTP